ncbi:hypothetical protein OS493_014373 [Desmophyllum pertusum]|uniref:ZP domain-containing protein n=1 Tax=Desmophyllum pertusum TaxID=174260 RepID=A0A9X0CMA9_9CNID|nr:hypothetical protein OS493_014373 [Desmophyllum pertusum]
MDSNTSIFFKNCLAWIFLSFLTLATAQTTRNADYTGIHVRCKANYMQLTLERQHFAKIDPSSLHLTDRSCGPWFHNSSLMIIRAPLGGCGTRSAQEGRLLGFRNEVYADVIGRSAIAREAAYQFRLHCLYYTTAKITLHSFKPETKVIVEPPTEFGNFTFETNMFQTGKYISKYTQFPVKVHISESIYLQVHVKSNASGLSMLLENCWATPTPTANDSQSHTLIKDGCPVDPYLNYKAAEAGYQRFSFDAFKMEGADVMFLHCEVLVCAKDDVNRNSTRCSEGCVKNSGGSRKRRETNQGQQKGVTSLGPLKILLDRLVLQGPDQAGLVPTPLSSHLRRRSSS